MKVRITLLLHFVAIGLFAQVSEGKPKLIVGIVVDQMRNDYLFRYEDMYREDGFKRLIKDGFYGANHHFSYAPTTTGPGHASVYTGTTPAVHGIAANNWYDPRIKADMYCVEDKSVKTIGAANADGQMSPKNLRTSTITDELMLLWNFRSKVIGVALKDRGSILPAGHLGTAYWYSKGDFISSSFYMESLPKWVSDFNKKNLVDKYLKSGWAPSYPMEKYLASEPDDSPYEKILVGEDQPLMPKDLSKLAEGNGGRDLIKYTPYGNTLTLEFAKAALLNEQLGKDAITDFLAISLSSPDYMGHAYGPRALEIQDMYLKLDAEIAELLNFLDREVGKGAYTVFLTADHGAAEVGAYSRDNNLPGGTINKKDFKEKIDVVLNEMHPDGASLVESFDENKIFFDHVKVKAAGLNIDALCADLAHKITGMDAVHAAYPVKSVLYAGAQDFPLLQLQRGLYPATAGDLVVVFESGYIAYGATGTTHGSPWRYDTHTPLLFYGMGVKPGKTYRQTNIRDIAPTISMMFDIPLPSGSTGVPIEPLLEPR